MASIKVKRSSSGLQPKRPGLPHYDKLRTYETLHSLNRGFELVLLNLKRFNKLGFRREFLNAFTVILQHLRARTNQELTQTQSNRELDDQTHFGRLKDRRERRFRDPHDVLLEAKRIRQAQRAMTAHSDSKHKRRS